MAFSFRLAESMATGCVSLSPVGEEFSVLEVARSLYIQRAGSELVSRLRDVMHLNLDDGKGLVF